MKFLAAYLLASLSEEKPNLKKINSILSSVGIESNDEKVNLIIDSLKDKTIAEVIAEGSSKLASVPSGGSASAAATTAGASTAAAAVEEEAAKEEEGSDDDDMGFGLFD